MTLIPGGVQVTDFIKPTDDQDQYPTHKDEYGQGGYRSVNNLTERNNIPMPRRKAGMRVFVIGDQEYRLEADMVTWTAKPDNTPLPADIMLKQQYDSNNDGVVNDSDKLAGKVYTYYLDRINHQGSQAISTVVDLQNQLNLRILTSEKGVAGGLATLGLDGKVVSGQLPASSLQWKGAWNPLTNVPAISDADLNSYGFWYKASVAGSRDLGSGSITFAQNDWVVNNGTKWEKNGDGNTVASVNGMIGPVMLTLDNIPETATKKLLTTFQKALLDAVVTAGAGPGNRLATMNDLPSLGAISVIGEFHTPDVYANGHGNGTNTLTPLSTLTNPATSLPYTLPQALSLWPNVNNLTLSMSLDTVIVQEALGRLRGNATWKSVTFPENKYYAINRAIALPRFEVTTGGAKTNQFRINAFAACLRNATGAPLLDDLGQPNAMLYQMPVNQADAESGANNLVQFHYIVEGLRMVGADLARGSGDDGFKLGATYGSRFDNCTFEHFDVGAYNYFCLKPMFMNCNFNDNAGTGLIISHGLWPGSSVPASGSNDASVASTKFRCAPGSFAGVQVIGSDGVNIGCGMQSIFEGSASGTHPEYHIYFDGMGATTVKQFFVDNLHIEQLCSKVNINIKMDGQAVLAEIRRLFPQGITNALLGAQTGPVNGVVMLDIYNCPANFSGYKLRKSGGGYYHFWMDKVSLNNDANPYAAANWDLTTIDAIPGDLPIAGQITFDNPILYS